MSDPGAERNWWCDAGDDDLHGVPPYDVHVVADRIMRSISQVPGFALAADMTVLDLGCGRGRLAALMAGRIIGPNTRVWGVDIAAHGQWEAGHAVDFVICDGRSIPVEIGRIDAAWSVAMFQHIPHDAMWGYIGEVERHLKPGGVFTFTVAVGPVDEFLNHQLSDRDAFVNDLSMMFERVAVDYTDDPAWTWITATKGS